METKSARILLIEDDEMLSGLYTELLRDRGYSVDTAADGNQALEKIKKEHWNLIISDIIIPGMDGFQVIEQARKEGIIPVTTKVIFMTNLYNSDQDKRAVLKGDAYLVKVQLTPENFLQEVEKSLSNHQ